MRSHAKASVVVLIAVLALALGATLAAATAPTVTIDPPSEVEYDSTQVSGTVDPEDGAESSCRFEYTTLASFEAEDFAAAAQIGCEAEAPLTGTDPVAVKAALTGLEDDTEYRVRLFAENEGEMAESSVESFKTLAVSAPSVSVNDATDVSYITAKATGTVEVADPDNAFEASCRFEYVTQETYEAEGNAFPAEGAPSASCEPGAVSGSEAQPVEVKADLTGLAPATTYHLRIVATNLGGTSTAEAAGTFTTLVVSAPAVTIDPVTVFDADSAEVAGMIDPGNADPAFDSTYRIEYSSDGGANWTDATFHAQGPLSGPGAQGVSDTLDGLEPNTAYQVRIVAVNVGGETTSAPVSFMTTKAKPIVELAATIASGGKVTLASRIDPNNDATTYQFQFGPTAAYGTTLPATPASAGSGGTWELVREQVASLEPDTTYYYRVIATNSAGTTEGPDRTVATGPPLPDGRAYELVSPASKNGSDVMIDSGRTRVAAAGDAVQFTSLGGFGDAHGTGIGVEYISQRADDGWRTHAITPLLNAQSLSAVILAGFDPRYMGDFSDDLGAGVFMSNRLLTPEGANVERAPNLYVRRDLRTPGSGTFQLASDSIAAVVAPINYKPFFAGASEDFSHVLFTSTLNLTGQTTGTRPKLYEWVEGIGVRLAGVLPADEGGGPAFRSIAGQGRFLESYTPHTISRDGSRVFFTVGATNSSADGQLYLRENGSATVRINASERTSEPDLEQPATFWDASEDGAIAYFTTRERLVDDDDNSDVDLYRYDVDAPSGAHLTRTSVDREPGDVANDVTGVLGVSEQGDYVYFTGASQLVPGKLRRPASGELLAFVWHAGEVAFVGTLTDDDDTELIAQGGWGNSPKTGRVSPDGKHLLLTSRGRVGLTGYNSGVCAPSTGAPCRQIYVYSADANDGTGALACASCRPDGVTATADADVMFRVATGGSASGAALPKALTDDGRRVIFTTGEALVPEDQNGTSQDVYIYDVQRGGLDLISTGKSESDSYFMGAGASGDDVFFATRERLVGADVDGNYDIYDARVGGGFPESAPPPVCVEDGCQGPPSTAPAASTPGTASLSFAGNVRQRSASGSRCAKGRRKVTRGGKVRCEKKGSTRKRNDKRNRRAGR